MQLMRKRSRISEVKQYYNATFYAKEVATAWHNVDDKYKAIAMPILSSNYGQKMVANLQPCLSLKMNILLIILNKLIFIALISHVTLTQKYPTQS
jgi:hypothetical protein